MSAFIVSDRHINALATAATRLGAPAGQQVAEILLRENERSVAYRYREEPAGAAIIYSPETVTGAELVAACDCFDYQACETPDYETTCAGFIVRFIRLSELARLGWPQDGYKARPEWQAAPWGLD